MLIFSGIVIQVVGREKTAGWHDTTSFRGSAKAGSGTVRSRREHSLDRAALTISPSSVSTWRSLEAETGSLDHGKIGRHKKPRLPGEVADGLRERCRSSLYTRRLTAELGQHRSDPVSEGQSPGLAVSRGAG